MGARHVTKYINMEAAAAAACDLPPLFSQGPSSFDTNATPGMSPSVAYFPGDLLPAFELQVDDPPQPRDARPLLGGVPALQPPSDHCLPRQDRRLLQGRVRARLGSKGNESHRPSGNGSRGSNAKFGRVRVRVFGRQGCI